MSLALDNRDGVWWPKGESGCRAVISGEIDKLGAVIPLCRGTECAVQAGGNVGLMPAALSKHFKVVWSFEPAAVNASAAERNLAGNPRVRLVQAALGEKFATVSAALPNGDAIGEVLTNCGAVQTRPGGCVPVIPIDMLRLEACDLIMLDIEGDELAALRGGSSVIAEFRPVVVIEDKGLSERHGIAKGAAPKWLADNFEYRAIMNLGRDIVLVPAEHRSVARAV